jgi:hypothetical protein
MGGTEGAIFGAGPRSLSFAKIFGGKGGRPGPAKTAFPHSEGELWRENWGAKRQKPEGIFEMLIFPLKNG